MKLRVLTFNVWNDEGSDNLTALINREIRRLKPDLISFQEVVRKPGFNQLAELISYRRCRSWRDGQRGIPGRAGHRG
jgi:hypothetical protein